MRVKVVHGHQMRPRGDLRCLTMLAKGLGVSILVSGHTLALREGVRGHSPREPGLCDRDVGRRGRIRDALLRRDGFTDDKRLVVYLYELEGSKVVLRARKEAPCEVGVLLTNEIF